MMLPSQQLSMTEETGHNKEEGGEVEEEDEAMQNTVVLFSNTDKFVLLQVQRCHFTFPFTRDICWHLPGREQNDVKDRELKMWFVTQMLSSRPPRPVSRGPHSFPGHVCRVWQFWEGSRGTAVGLCSVCTVLPSILRKQQGNTPVTDLTHSLTHITDVTDITHSLITDITHSLITDITHSHH